MVNGQYMDPPPIYPFLSTAMNCTSVTDICVSLCQVEVETNLEDIINNENAWHNWVDVCQTCQTIVSMLDVLLTDNGDIGEGSQSNCSVGSQCINAILFVSVFLDLHGAHHI
jgi:hypothetical protein